MKKFNYKNEPGKKNNNIACYKKIDVSIVIPFYNDGLYIEQTINSILNQTFQDYEILIIDDGSKDEKSLRILDRIEKIDKRIKIFHKENEGLAATRDYGAAKADKNSKYLLFVDSDDLISETYIEKAVTALETNPTASWAYSDTVGFGNMQYLWNKWFDSDVEKIQNILIAMALIRKKDFIELKGYEIKEKGVNEDWNFWLKMISKKKYPVHIACYEQWYRRKDNGELTIATKNRKKTKKIISKTLKKIKGRVDAIQFPNLSSNSVELEKIYNFHKGKKVYVEFEINDEDTCKRISNMIDKKDIVIVLMPFINSYYYELIDKAYIYNLSSFLETKNWERFIKYMSNNNTIYIDGEKIDIENVDKEIKVLLKNTIDRYNKMIEQYQIANYGQKCTDTNGNNIYNYKKEILSLILWKHKIWRMIVKSKLYKKIRGR